MNEAPAMAALAGVLGAVFGSFATAAAHRLPLNLPLATDRSRCPACKKPLEWRDLVPVLSWLALRGRCRRCGAAVPWRYPLTEAATAALFVLAWLRAEDWPQAAALGLLITGLAIVVLADLEHRLIPDKVLAVLLPLGLGWQWLHGWSMPGVLLSAAAGLGVGLALRLGFRALKGSDGLGLGDVKFLAVAGVWLGVEALPAFLIAAGLAGVGFGLLWRLAGKGPVFPFGPALAAALLLCLLAPEIALAEWLSI